MENSEIKNLIRAFVRKHRLAVLSTVTDDGAPESAVLEFGDTDDLELIFDTSVDFRKYANMKHEERVAFVIGWDEDITVQYEGRAIELFGEESTKYQEIYFAKNPKARQWAGRPEMRYFKVVPMWIRYSDLNVHPWKVHELTFAKN